MHINVTALICFVLGLAIHVLAQVDAIARAPNNPKNSRLHILRDRAIPIIVRSAVSVALFVLWLQGQLADTITAVGMPLPEWAGKVLDLHVGGGIAFLSGYGFDSALAYLPALKSSVPPPIDMPEAP